MFFVVESFLLLVVKEIAPLLPRLVVYKLNDNLDDFCLVVTNADTLDSPMQSRSNNNQLANNNAIFRFFVCFLLTCNEEVVANLIKLRQTNKSRCNNAMNADGCAYNKCCSLIASLPRSISDPSIGARGLLMLISLDLYVGIATSIRCKGKGLCLLSSQNAAGQAGTRRP